MLTVVTGPPCSGKTTHVAHHRDADDLVIDLDAIAHAMGYPTTQIEWDSTHPAVTAARMARAHVIHALTTGRLRANAWVIDAEPSRAIRAQYERAGAHFVTVNPGQAVCRERATQRSTSTVEGIDSWFARHPDQVHGNSRAKALDIFDSGRSPEI